MVDCILVFSLMVLNDTYFIQYSRICRVQLQSQFEFQQRCFQVVHSEVLHADVKGRLVAAWE